MGVLVKMDKMGNLVSVDNPEIKDCKENLAKLVNLVYKVHLVSQENVVLTDKLELPVPQEHQAHQAKEVKMAEMV